VGHLQVVTGLSDQLYRNAWSVLGEFWGERGGSRSHYNSGYHGLWVLSGGLPLVVCGALIFQSGYYSYAKLKDHATHCYNEISTRPLPQNSPRTLHAFLYN